jgi:protein arginine N-methyltransferase 1
MAAANGYTERIEFVQDMSTRVTLPEPAEVIVSDMHGALPLFEQNLPALIDARRRLLAPGGTMIPQQDSLWVATVEAPELYRRHVSPWQDNCYGFDLRAALCTTTNMWLKGRVTPEQLLVEPRSWAILDYAMLQSPDVYGTVTLPAVREGTGHGLLVWFDALLTAGVQLSNAPEAPELIYGSAFFPWLSPVRLAIGDTISVTIRANLIGEDYLWRWDTRVLHQGCPDQVKASFQQSTFFSVPVSREHLHKLAASHVPRRNEEGQIDQWILGMMDGEMSLGDIAYRVLDRFPTRFANWHDALTRVGELSRKYSP